MAPTEKGWTVHTSSEVQKGFPPGCAVIESIQKWVKDKAGIRCCMKVSHVPFFWKANAQDSCPTVGLSSMTGPAGPLNDDIELALSCM